MGPRSADRGKPAGLISSGSRVTLQWGRGQLTAERQNAHDLLKFLAALQWGRGQLTAERREPLDDVLDPEVASMGPRSADRGKACPCRRRSNS